MFLQYVSVELFCYSSHCSVSACFIIPPTEEDYNGKKVRQEEQQQETMLSVMTHPWVNSRDNTMSTMSAMSAI